MWFLFDYYGEDKFFLSSFLHLFLVKLYSVFYQISCAESFMNIPPLSKQCGFLSELVCFYYNQSNVSSMLITCFSRSMLVLQLMLFDSEMEIMKSLPQGVNMA